MGSNNFQLRVQNADLSWRLLAKTVNMKHLSILLLLFFSTGSEVYCQNNLVLDTIIYKTLIHTSGNSTWQVTIPTGKVWKIENVILSRLDTNEYFALTLEGQILARASYSTSSGEYTNFQIQFPLWLPPGDYTFYTAHTNPTSGRKASVSIIEFNIVP